MSLASFVAAVSALSSCAALSMRVLPLSTYQHRRPPPVLPNRILSAAAHYFERLCSCPRHTHGRARGDKAAPS